jgi:hypothetical protein
MLIGISQKFKGTELNVVEGIRFIDWGVATKVQSNLSINKLTQLLLPVNKYVGEQVDHGFPPAFCNHVAGTGNGLRL